MVGLYAEKNPDGFAFSDTAFRAFILMASRRLNSDPFFTSEFNEDTYTKAGLEWIRQSTLSSVLERNVPELKDALRGVRNVFKPWDSPTNRHLGWWPRKQRFWNRLARFKFLLTNRCTSRSRLPGERVSEKAFKDLHPDIPIEGLVVADHFPENEVDPIVLRFIQARGADRPPHPTCCGRPPAGVGGPVRSARCCISGGLPAALPAAGAPAWLRARNRSRAARRRQSVRLPPVVRWRRVAMGHVGPR